VCDIDEPSLSSANVEGGVNEFGICASFQDREAKVNNTMPIYSKKRGSANTDHQW
jgi:hypothetical protein